MCRLRMYHLAPALRMPGRTILYRAVTQLAAKSVVTLTRQFCLYKTRCMARAWTPKKLAVASHKPMT